MRGRGMTACLLLAGALMGPGRACAQWDVSGYESHQTPLPLGSDRPESGGIYGAVEFLFMHGNRNIGSQLLAVRGFVDSDGSISGQSGQFIGSKRQALTTEEFGRTTWTPGARITLGYRLEDGSAISVSWAHLDQARYNTSAGPVPVDFNTNRSGEDAFLFSPVYGFSPQFSGPSPKVSPGIGSGGSPYGIWNGANTMDIKYVSRFDNVDITYRVPVVETELSRTFALAGGRYSFIFERFYWSTLASDYLGRSGPQDSANYTNTLSQRMYGPFIGCHNAVYLGSAFELTTEVTGSALFDIAKERAKYVLGDGSTQSKRGRNEFTIVPNANASINLAWYPISGVQIRAGYELWSYFNSIYMNQPVGFNAGAIDPAYNHRALRFYHGFTVGVGINF